MFRFVGCFVLCLLVPLRVEVCAEPVQFNRDIRPILAAKCLACHGPDEGERQADLRLDQRDSAVALTAIVPGQPDQSELIRRVFSDDPDERMPPPDGGKPLTTTEQKLLRQWIAEGALFTEHWAFAPPQKASLPAVDQVAWARNPIDLFVLARLEQEHIDPSVEADRYTLARRLFLDLTGVPPTPDAVDAFVHDARPDAYERLVDRLLASPRYGERWARWWLDVARYSDTNGYEKDRERSVWPYRDWVIQALNEDMPFDQFSIEQIAGDMLPQATDRQRIATGFHRNTMLNEEGGIDPLEFRFYAMVDRVATTGLVWMGLTTGCAQCHSHKYDPISHQDYYRLMAYLDNADEPDLIVQDAPSSVKRRSILQQIAQLESSLADQFPPDEGDGPEADRRASHLHRRFAEWLQQERAQAVPWQVLRPYAMQTNSPKLELMDDGSIFSSGDITKRDLFELSIRLRDAFPTPPDSHARITALRLEVLPDDRLPARGPGRTYYEGLKGEFFLSEFKATHDQHPILFRDGSHTYGKTNIGSGSADAKNVYDGDGSSGWSTAGQQGQANYLVLNLSEPVPADGELQIELLFERHFATSLGRFRISATTHTGEVKARQVPVDVESLLAIPAAQLTPDQEQRLQRYFMLLAPELAGARGTIDELRQQLPELTTTMVLQERAPDNPRATHRRHRGEYLSTKELVTPGLPDWLDQLTEHVPQNRLEFAEWLVSKNNPLVARVTVNRIWQNFFGAGLERSNGDFGTQSDAPTHPELLDWLACEVVQAKWSLKMLHRLIVTSATYRQSARRRDDAHDPENRLLGRGPRFRMDAEMTRDTMLLASGLLVDRMYGPGVHPPQPASVTALAYGSTAWSASEGADRYRRSIYTFSKRTAPFAAYTVFDAPSGEQCTVQRDRSNTPLQALTLLNDEMFQEMARALARQVQGSPAERATTIFRRLLVRPPSDAEVTRILDFQRRQQLRLQNGELNAASLVKSPSATADEAAWILVARALMNVDEAITH